MQLCERRNSLAVSDHVSCLFFSDFRFVVPSTRAPVVIAVGPLEQESFLLLGRKPQATVDDERTYDNRTHSVSEQVS